jgi:hypothetical protein
VTGVNNGVAGVDVAGNSRLVPFASIRNVVDGTLKGEILPVNARERDAHLALAQLFVKHGFDWRKPFCLTCYQAWHASLSQKRDIVTVTGDMLTLRTTTPESNLREVTLVFHRDSYRIVRQAFTFEGLGRVEFEELERQEAPPVSAPIDRRASADQSRASVNTEAKRLPATATSRPPAAGDVERTAPRRLALSRWLERTFPKSAVAERTAFLPNLEQRAGSVRKQLVVLQRLVNRDASEKSANASEADRVRLQQQIELEYQTLRMSLHALEEHMDILVGSKSRARDLTRLPDDWQRRASIALPHATRLEYRLQRLFTRDDLPSEETRVDRPRSLRATFEALWEAVHGELQPEQH